MLSTEQAEIRERNRPQVHTLEEFIEQYRRLCGFYARKFAYRLKHKDDGEKNCDHQQGQIEDLASEALLRLVRCKPEHWNNYYYVQRVIINAIIDAQSKQLKVLKTEIQPPVHIGTSRKDSTADYHDFFDTIEGRDGLANATQTKYDAKAIQELLPTLDPAERIVMEFTFGLNGVSAISARAIAQKLGRTQFWIERRLASGLAKIRQKIGIKAVTTHARAY